MNRRNFLKQTATIAPLIVAFNPLAAAQKGFLQNLLLKGEGQNKVLVLIQLNGGNDGLNTIIPIDKYDILSVARKNILIPENKILKLNDTNIFGLHPSMAKIQNLYNDKLVSFIQGVGYPNPDFSHFHGIDIKYTANTEKQGGKSGWVGRYLEREYSNYPKGYPLHMTDGPPSIRVGMVSPKIAQGKDEDMSIGITNIYNFNFTSSALNNKVETEDMAGMKVNTIMSISKQIELYAPIIQEFAKKQETLSKLYPEDEKNTLADQLKMVAKLIGSGLNTRIYIVSQSGYDTHGEQVEQSDTTIGKHAVLLGNLSEAIAAFQDDIQLMGKADDVIGMTFSEFGRRIASSDSYGTDHGTAESVILFGSKAKNGIIGSSPDLPAKVSGDDNLTMQYDFRALYASVLTGWFGLSEDTVGNIIPQAPRERMSLFKA
jgi:uncharacterized protein (DUF1501 family)